MNYCSITTSTWKDNRQCVGQCGRRTAQRQPGRWCLQKKTCLPHARGLIIFVVRLLAAALLDFMSCMFFCCRLWKNHQRRPQTLHLSSYLFDIFRYFCEEAFAWHFCVLELRDVCKKRRGKKRCERRDWGRECEWKREVVGVSVSEWETESERESRGGGDCVEGPLHGEKQANPTSRLAEAWVISSYSCHSSILTSVQPIQNLVESPPHILLEERNSHFSVSCIEIPVFFFLLLLLAQCMRQTVF